MLLWLTEILSQHFTALTVFQYLTLRGILGTLTALAISLLIGPVMIRKLSQYQIGQSVRDDGPQTHLSKAGTPTMGGALILVAIGVSTLLWADLGNRYVWVTILVTLLFGAIGWVDDYRKVVERNPRGLPARWKYFWQSLIGAAAAMVLFFSSSLPQETSLYVPFFKNVSLTLGPVIFILLTYFVIVGSSNAVNLTDGLDGLAIMPTVMVAGALGLFAYLSGHAQFANYLLIPHLPGTGELIVFCGALVGAGLGFLWFNTYPAQHGGCRGAGAGGSPWRCGCDRPSGDCPVYHGRCVRHGDHLGHPASGVIPVNRSENFPHGTIAPPFRIEGLA